MTLEHGASEAEVKIRMPVHFWVLKLATGWCGLAIAAGLLWIDHRVFNAPLFAALAGAQVALIRLPGNLHKASTGVAKRFLACSEVSVSDRQMNVIYSKGSSPIFMMELESHD